MPMDFDGIIDSFRVQYPSTLDAAQVAEILGSAPEVVRTKVARSEISASVRTRVCGFPFRRAAAS